MLPSQPIGDASLPGGSGMRRRALPGIAGAASRGGRRIERGAETGRRQPSNAHPHGRTQSLVDEPLSEFLRANQPIPDEPSRKSNGRQRGHPRRSGKGTNEGQVTSPGLLPSFVRSHPFEGGAPTSPFPPHAPTAPHADACPGDPRSACCEKSSIGVDSYSTCIRKFPKNQENV